MHAPAFSLPVGSPTHGRSVPLFTEAHLRAILADAHAHYEAQVGARTGLALEDPDAPTDAQMLDWMIASFARIVLRWDGGPYYVYHFSSGDYRRETYGPDADTPRAAIVAAMKDDK